MKFFLKKTYTLFNKIVNTFVYVMAVVLFSSYRANHDINKCIKNHKKNHECIILGNGPSINKVLDEKNISFESRDIFCVNYFCLTNYFERLQPKFCVLIDQVIFNFNEDNSLKNKNNELLAILNKVSWTLVLFIPIEFKNSSLVNSINNKKINIIFINTTPFVEGINAVENIFYNKNLAMPRPESVINACIFLGINLKYKQVNLYGVEASWLKDLKVTKDNKVLVSLEHFYKGKSSISGHSSLQDLSTFLSSQANYFESHIRLEKYAKSKNVRILNHTIDSYIDAYDKVYADFENNLNL